METIGIGVLGLGTVATGVVRILEANRSVIESRLGARIQVERVAVQDAGKPRAVSIEAGRLTTRADDVIEDDAVRVVVELMGGTGEARRLVLAAIAQGKHVVTANKTLIAKHGAEVFAAAKKSGVDVFYEAAVGGGIPIIRTLREGLASERVQVIRGILNGTTNFILSEMAARGAAYEDVLAEAQALGFAEADPTADVDGHDAAQKLAILAGLGFGAHVTEADVEADGIRGVTAKDIAIAQRHGYAIKLLAVGEQTPDHELALGVYPAWVSRASNLAHVNGAENAIELESAALGRSTLIGQGAGELPTGSAVVADIIDVVRNIRIGSTGRVPLQAAAEALQPVALADRANRVHPFYLRFSVSDAPGVLGRIADALGRSAVSLRIVEQEARGSQAPVDVIAVTHPAPLGALQEALSAIEQLDACRAPVQMMRIYDPKDRV